MILTLLTHMVIASARTYPAGAPPRRHTGDFVHFHTVQQAMNFIRTHLSEPLTLPALAQKYGLSTAYFSRIFKQYSGFSFRDYLTRARVAQVICMLQTQNINILDAALSAGFSSSSGFYRTFRSVTGTTPKHFQKQTHLSGHAKESVTDGFM